jgi:hypothetical protein
VKKTNAALRKPPPVLQPVDPVAADQFVSGRLDVQAPERLVSVPSPPVEPEPRDFGMPAIEAPPMPSASPAVAEAPRCLDIQTSTPAPAVTIPVDVQTSKRSVVARADGRTLKRMTVYLPVDLARQLAVHCAEHDRDMSEVIATSLARTLGRSDV